MSRQARTSQKPSLPCRHRYLISGLLITLSMVWIAGSLYFLWTLSSQQQPGSTDYTLLPLSYTVNKYQYQQAIAGLSYRKLSRVSDDIQEPPLFTLQTLLKWSPHDTSTEGWKRSPAHPNKNQGIARFDYSNPVEREKAKEYRVAEIPFVLTNVKAVDEASANHFAGTELLEEFGKEPRYVEKSADNHFMYYSVRKSKLPDGWTPPQEDVQLTFPEFLEYAIEAEQDVDTLSWKERLRKVFSKNEQAIDPSTREPRSLHYMTISATEGLRTKWIKKSFPMFNPDEEDGFWIVDASGFKGINCRFGMRGVIAAAHYDGGRNHVAMVRGRKRYMLLPPRECDKLSLLPHSHPSGRHSGVDWADPSVLAAHPELQSALGTEVVLSMGEVLYIPSFWFHYIVSQDASIQCNARSGSPEGGKTDLYKCGFGS